MFLSGTLIDNIFDRLMLAALHFNENGMREQATTKEGKKRYDVVSPKFKKGGIHNSGSESGVYIW